jgi:hypothetical protein
LVLDSRDAFLRQGNAVMSALYSGMMPPGSVDRSGTCGEYRGYKPVTPEDIDVIAAFLDAAVVTDHKDVHAVSRFAAPQGTPEGYLLPRYVPSAEGDDHRCFVLSTSPAAGPVLTAIDIEREPTSALHHLMLFSLPSPSAVAHAQALESEEPAAGFPCEGHPRVAGTELLSVWTPGQGTISFPADTGVAMRGSVLLVQAHFHVEEQVETHPDLREEELSVILYTAHDVPTTIRPIPIAASGFTLPPGEERVEFTLSQFTPFSEPVIVHGVFPHMHALGSSVSLTMGSEEQTEGEAKCLAQSARWRFDWQDTAFFETAISLAPSTPLTLHCVWDTRGRSEATHWGEGSLDEMCTLFLFVSSAQNGT